MTAARIVVLRFASGIRVDLVRGKDEADAIADFTAALLRTGGVALPLLEAITAEVPIARLSELAGEVALPPPVPQRPSLSLMGLLAAVRHYNGILGKTREQTAIDEARAELARFFGRYEVDLDLRVAQSRAAE